MADPKALPDQQTLSKAAMLDVFKAKGEKVKFGSLFEKEKTIVIFIRHFFCGACQAFVEDLATVPKESLDQAGTRIVIIGCGEASVIPTYIELTKYDGEIYADPSRELYRALGMTIETLARKPAGQETKSYIRPGFLVNALKSMWRGHLSHPTMIGKQGNHSQLGGDFVFGPGNTCSFSSRMIHTEDHVEVADLMKAAGVSL